MQSTTITEICENKKLTKNLVNRLGKCWVVGVLQGVGLAKLIDEPLRSFRFLHDAFTIVLAYGTAELVVIHGRPVFTLAP